MFSKIETPGFIFLQHTTRECFFSLGSFYFKVFGMHVCNCAYPKRFCRMKSHYYDSWFNTAESATLKRLGDHKTVNVGKLFILIRFIYITVGTVTDLTF